MSQKQNEVQLFKADNPNYNAISQANALTISRYDFNRIEKNALYCIIRQVRHDYVEHQADHYDNLHVKLDKSILYDVMDEKHAGEAFESMKKLRHKDIDIHFDNGSWLTVGFINWAEYNAETNEIDVEVSYQIMPYLVNLASRFTTYSLTVAISLKSKWSQRLYEMCCQYRNSGTFEYTFKQMKEYFMVEDMYKQVRDFKLKILDVAQKELKSKFDNGQCDVWFEYMQTGRGTTSKFSFKVHSVDEEKRKVRQKDGQELDRDTAINYIKAIYSLLYKVFKRKGDEVFIKKAIDYLSYHTDQISEAYDKIDRIANDKSYQTLNDRAAVMRYMFRNDFGVK